MRARTGKIARLPGAIRHELSRRLHNGALGRELVPWLNALPEVHSVLAVRFAGRPITEDNISAWRSGGHQDWLREEERRIRVTDLAAEFPELDPAQRARRIAAHAEEQLALALTEELERLSTIQDSGERWKCFQRLSHEICRLHRTRTHDRQLRLFEAKTRRAHSKSSSLPIPATLNRTFSGLSGPNTRGEGATPKLTTP
jgi:hypothetical protein